MEHSSTIRVRYADVDAMGWVYYANYLTYFEVGRTELIRQVWRSYRAIEEQGWLLPVIEAGCRYLRGARYDDLLEVHSRMSFPTAVRVRFDYRITREAELLAEGYTIHCFTTRAGKPVAIPRDLRAVVRS